MCATIVRSAVRGRRANALSGYNALYAEDRKPALVVEAACWAHCSPNGNKGRTQPRKYPWSALQPFRQPHFRNFNALRAEKSSTSHRVGEVRLAERVEVLRRVCETGLLMGCGDFPRSLARKIAGCSNQLRFAGTVDFATS